MVNVQLDKKDGGNTHTYSSEVPACRQTYEKKSGDLHTHNSGELIVTNEENFSTNSLLQTSFLS